MDKVADYVKSTPEKCYRKGGDVWLLNECWNDEIVDAPNPYGRPDVVRGVGHEVSDEEEENKLRNANRGVSVRDKIKLSQDMEK